MENNISKSRVVYLDILRLVATFAVIMIHVTTHNIDSIDIHSFQWTIQIIYDGFSRWAVGVFVMISGALFLEKQISIDMLFKKYIMRMIRVYICWSFAYSFFYNIIGRHDLRLFIRDFIKGHFHLWFLYMIVGLYFIVPFLHRIISNRTLTIYFLILAFIFAFLVPQCISIISIFSEKYGTFAKSVIDQGGFYFVQGFPLYFVLGYFLNNEKISKKIISFFYVTGILSFIITIIGNIFVSYWCNASKPIFSGYTSVNVLLESVFVFIFCKRLYERNLFVNDTANRFICTLSKYSFGVYLIHVVIISILNTYLHLNSETFFPIISIPFISLIVYFVSFAVSAVLNKIPLAKHIV